MPLTAALLLRIFLPFAAGYFLSYLYRVVNAVLAPTLLHELGVGPAALGLLTATYFIAFASAQLPLGVLLDRYGPRKIEALLLVIAAAGALCFARAESVPLLIFGRALIGLGVSACLMAAFKAYTQWFPREKWPLVNGFQMAAGGLGALAATSPIQWMLQWTDWRGVFTGLGIVTLVVAALVYFVVPPKKASNTCESLGQQLHALKEVFNSALFWRIAPLTALSQASFFAIQGLWSTPWLRDVAGLGPQAVVSTLFWIALTMVAGFISLGALAERFHRIGIAVRTSAVGGMVLFMVIQCLLLLQPKDWSTPLWLLFGFFGTSGIIAYAALTQSFPAHLSGRVNTAVNLLVFVAAFAAQWVVGVIVGCWPGPVQGYFAPIALKAGFAFLLLCQLLGLGWFFLAPLFFPSESTTE